MNEGSTKRIEVSDLKVIGEHHFILQLKIDLLGQLDRRVKHFKSLENSKSIVQEILNYTLTSKKS